MKVRLTVLAISAVLLSALTLGVASPVQAQDQRAQPQQLQQQTPTQPAEFSQSQLESFASAALKVQEIRAKWQPQVQEAESAEKAQALQEQAGAEIVSAVQEKGLTVETYNAIVVAARNDPELAGRIGKIIDKTR